MRLSAVLRWRIPSPHRVSSCPGRERPAPPTEHALLVLGRREKGRHIVPSRGTPHPACCLPWWWSTGAHQEHSVSCYHHGWGSDNIPFDVLSTIQKFVCGRGYLRAVDVSSFCTPADGVIGQMISCTNNGRILLVIPLQSSRSTFSRGNLFSFLPSKKACWAHQFQYLGVDQQYPGV